MTVQKSSCGYPWQQMIIDLTGEVVPCCFWSGYGNGGKPLGNTNAQTIEEIWNGPAYQALRRANAGDEPPPGHPCHKCLAYHWSNDRYPPFKWPNAIDHDDRLAYRVPVIADSIRSAAKAGLPVALLEDGIALGPADAVHEDIRSLGGGRYSVWQGALYFSASDNSDPRRNGRSYELVCGEQRSMVGGFHANVPSGQNLTLAHQEYEAGAEVMTAKPSMLTLVSTADCNIDCPSCSQNIVREVRVQHRPETVPSVLALVPYLSEFTWQGGEPFLIKRLRDFVDNFKTEENPNLVFGFTSNGTMITAREVEKLKKFTFLNASISIDSFNPATFEKIRTGAKLDRVLQNTLKLYELYDAPHRVISVGMIVCKSNMAELAQNLRYAIDHDIGVNLSPVLVYPVTERLDVFEDFKAQTQGWEVALNEAEALVAQAHRDGRIAVRRIDPTGMLRELRRIYERQRERYADTVDVDVVIHSAPASVSNMADPGITVLEHGNNSNAIAYIRLKPDRDRYRMRLPRSDVERIAKFDWYVSHSMLDALGSFDLGVHINPALKQGRRETVEIEIAPFNPSPVPRNIEVANYGESDPQGLNVLDPEDIYVAYNVDMGRKPRGFRADGMVVPKLLAPRHGVKRLLMRVRALVS